MLNLRFQLAIHITTRLVFVDELLGGEIRYGDLKPEVDAFLAMLFVNSEVEDDLNNVGRYCTLPNDIRNRRNKVMMRVNFQRRTIPLKAEGFGNFNQPEIVNSIGYACLNIDTGKVRVVTQTRMYCLY